MGELRSGGYDGGGVVGNILNSPDSTPSRFNLT